MQMFACNKCNNVDLVDLVFIDGKLPLNKKLQLCTKCKSGKWHDKFEEKQFDPSKDIVINRPSNLGLDSLG